MRGVLPGPLTGFSMAVMVGAILSSFNSALNSACTLFSHGIYRGLWKPEATEADLVASGRNFGIALAVVSMAVALLLIGQESIFGYLQKMNGLYFILILAVVLVGLLTRRVGPLAAKAGLLGGLVLIAIGYFVPIGTTPAGVNAGGVAVGVRSYAVAGGLLHDYHFLAVVFVLLVGGMLVIGRLRPRGGDFVHADAGAVDLTPWRLAVPVGVALLLAVFSIYAFFADLSALGK